jgi:hypothetical protein
MSRMQHRIKTQKPKNFGLIEQFARDRSTANKLEGGLPEN